ncbi:hypothetical protein PVAP13_2KG536160 [Panicum virgatum]|uniref:Secreted protein n=1 Tax=Panicum virgatum TaxID=38727 RepID=A0A8T0WIQ4_PANVG|nr:hypothetical protein PVAP13_2KG536160 [Panicum virgatum]
MPLVVFWFLTLFISLLCRWSRSTCKLQEGLWVLELKRHCSPCGQIRTPLRTGYRPTPSLHAAPTGHRQPSEFTAKARFTISLHHPEGSVYSSCSIQDKRRAWVLAWSDDSLAGPAVAAQWFHSSSFMGNGQWRGRWVPTWTCPRSTGHSVIFII